MSAIPERWKYIIKKTYKPYYTTNLVVNDHNEIKSSTVLTLEKLKLTEIYSILISKVQNKLSSNYYFNNLFEHTDTDYVAIYKLQRLATYNTYMQSFQYNLLHNVLFLNKKLNIFGMSTPLCSFCNLWDETPFRIFYENMILSE